MVRRLSINCSLSDILFEMDFTGIFDSGMSTFVFDVVDRVCP